MSYTINAVTRTEIGKGSSRRLRHAGKVPAVIYGPGKEPVSITFEHKDIINIQLNENFYTTDLTIVLKKAPKGAFFVSVFYNSKP